MNIRGKHICFSGVMESMTRSQAKTKVEDCGGRVMASVYEKTDILVHGPGAGSKLTKAREIGCTLWTEEQFLAEVEKEQTK